MNLLSSLKSIAIRPAHYVQSQRVSALRSLFDINNPTVILNQAGSVTIPVSQPCVLQTRGFRKYLCKLNY